MADSFMSLFQVQDETTLGVLTSESERYSEHHKKLQKVICLSACMFHIQSYSLDFSEVMAR
jgi:hypothetical protein